LVLETYGAGNAPSGRDNAMTKVLENAIKRGIVIVNITQCKSKFLFTLLENLSADKPFSPTF
jgi:L-asparaginase/Glu-tRNA(Gln) amidotransferase subunit D